MKLDQTKRQSDAATTDNRRKNQVRWFIYFSILGFNCQTRQ